MQKIKTFIGLMGVALLLSAMLLQIPTVAQSERSKVLNFYNWSDYVDPVLVKEFEKQNGIRVNQTFYEGNDEMLAKIRQAGQGQYDLIVPSSDTVVLMRRENLLEPLEGKIPNLQNIAPQFQKMEHDPGNRFSVPYFFGTTGIAYRIDRVKGSDLGFGLFFEPKQQQGSFVLLDSAQEMIGAALIYLGYSFNSRNQNEIARALELLQQSRSRALGFDAAVTAGSKLASGQINYALVYSGNALKLSEENPKVGFALPKEGAELFLDTLAVPKGAANKELAFRFMNFLLEAKNSARNANFTRYATPNAAALATGQVKDAKNPILYPAPEVLKRLTLVGDLGNARPIYDAAWMRLKSR